MKSLGKYEVSLQNARKHLVGNDCNVMMTGGSSKWKIPAHVWLL